MLFGLGCGSGRLALRGTGFAFGPQTREFHVIQ